MARNSDPGISRDLKTGKWYFVTDTAPAGSPRRQVRRRGFKTKAEARAARDEMRRDVRKGVFVEPSRQTLERFLVDDWLPAVRGSLEPSTWASYDRYLRLHVIPRIGAIPLQALDPGTLNKLYSALLADGGRRDGKPGGLSPRTTRYLHTIVHRALKEAVAWGRLVRNPAGAALPPRAQDAQPPEMRTWSAPQLAEFLRLVEHSRYRAPWMFLATTGCRRGEALGLRWDDVDLELARASIRQTITAVEHKIRVAPRTKTGRGRGRAVDLDAATVEMLRAHRTRQAREFLLLGRRPQGDTLVFCFPDGRPYHPERFSREFDRRVERLGIKPRIRLHDLRHTWATLALGAGVPVKVVSERLGHKTTAITSDVYSHVTPTMQTDAAERVAGLIFGGG
jgi:integrase